MATLKLKKKPRTSKQVLDMPSSEMLGKFAVARQLVNVKSIRFTCYHDSLETAREEAKRLAATEQHYRYLVLQIVDTAGV